MASVSKPQAGEARSALRRSMLAERGKGDSRSQHLQGTGQVGRGHARVGFPGRLGYGSHHALVHRTQFDSQVVAGELLFNPLVAVGGAQGGLDGGEEANSWNMVSIAHRLR